MNLIERASQQIGSAPPKSLVEKAAESLGGPSPETKTPRAEMPPHMSLGGGRHTARRIDLDMQRLRSLGIAGSSDQSVIAEEFRLIKRPLLDNAFTTVPGRPENSHLIMVTSAAPNEGKTFVAINLAISMASEHDVHVLLIDADVAKPSLPRVLGFDAEAGLVDVVADPSIDLADVMIRTNIENLSLLPSGRYRPHTNELMASSRMNRFVEDIARRYSDRIIIFDSPPVLARTEPTVLAKHVGQIVFVVEAERTSRASITDALRLIDSGKPVGIVMNKTPPGLFREGFGQYYGYYRSDTAHGRG